MPLPFLSGRLRPLGERVGVATHAPLERFGCRHRRVLLPLARSLLCSWVYPADDTSNVHRELRQQQDQHNTSTNKHTGSSQCSAVSHTLHKLFPPEPLRPRLSLPVRQPFTCRAKNRDSSAASGILEHCLDYCAAVLLCFL